MKEIQLFDECKLISKAPYIKDTKIQFYAHGTNTLLWEGRNKSVLTGAPFTIYKQFDIKNETDIRTVMPVYDHFVLDTSVSSTGEAFNLDIYGDSDYSTYIQNVDDSKCYLWCVGTGGATSNPSQIVANEFASWIWPMNLIPFRVITQTDAESEDLDTTFSNTYYGKRTIEGATGEPSYCAYYFKKIEDVNIVIKRVGESTAITNNDDIKASMEELYREKYSYAGTNKVGEDVTTRTKYNTHETECYVETLLQITTTDLREWFQISDNSNINTEDRPTLNNSYINSLSLCEAIPILNSSGNVVDYCNITPLTKLNFYSRMLNDLDEGIDIRYQLYY